MKNRKRLFLIIGFVILITIITAIVILSIKFINKNKIDNLPPVEKHNYILEECIGEDKDVTVSDVKELMEYVKEYNQNPDRVTSITINGVTEIDENVDINTKYNVKVIATIIDGDGKDAIAGIKIEEKK